MTGTRARTLNLEAHWNAQGERVLGLTISQRRSTPQAPRCATHTRLEHRVFFVAQTWLEVTQVKKGLPGCVAGMRPGDILVGVGGRRVSNLGSLARALDNSDNPVVLTIKRREPESPRHALNKTPHSNTKAANSDNEDDKLNYTNWNRRRSKCCPTTGKGGQTRKRMSGANASSNELPTK